MYCPNCGKELMCNAKFCQECGSPISTDNQTSESSNFKYVNILKVNKDKQLEGKNIGIYVFIILLIIFSILSSESLSLREPQELKCVNHKNLCIATTDVKYDYTSVKTKTYSYPANGNEWNNGWAAAQNACKKWGGRLPYMEDFVTIIDAFNQNKIQLEDYNTYLSGSQINTYRIYAYSHKNDYRKGKVYDKNSIYDTAISIAKSGDNFIKGDYTTSSEYTWSARCVKDVK